MNGRRDSLFAFALVLAGMAGGALGSSAAAAQTARAHMQLTSSAWTDGASIPATYTCDARNISPPLKWTGVPASAKGLVLIADDPDAPMGTWVHWVLYDLPASTSDLPEDVAKSQFVPGGAKQGLNSFKHLGYGGPCPPPGKAHRYFFKLYALDTFLDLKPGASKKEVENAMARHILAEGQLMGTYKRH